MQPRATCCLTLYPSLELESLGWEQAKRDLRDRKRGKGGKGKKDDDQKDGAKARKSKSGKAKSGKGDTGGELGLFNSCTPDGKYCGYHGTFSNSGCYKDLNVCCSKVSGVQLN